MTDLIERASALQVLSDEIDLARIAMPQVIPILAADMRAIAAIPSATDTDAIRAAEDRGIAIGLRAAAAWASDEANKCDDAAKWGGHRTYVANCKAAAYALRNAVLKIGGIKTDEARKIGGGE